MTIDYTKDMHFFQRFSQEVSEELLKSRKEIESSIKGVESLVEKVESTSSKLLGIMGRDKKKVIDTLAMTLDKMEKYEEAFLTYYLDMRRVFCFIEQYTSEISNLKEQLKTAQEEEENMKIKSQKKTDTRNATDEFIRLSLFEKIEVTSKKIKNYTLFIESMKKCIEEKEVKDIVDLKIVLLSLKENLNKFFYTDSATKSDNYFKVFNFFHKEKISEKCQLYSQPYPYTISFMNICVTSSFIYLLYCFTTFQRESCYF
jgi:hypothetical protein